MTLHVKAGTSRQNSKLGLFAHQIDIKIKVFNKQDFTKYGMFKTPNQKDYFFQLLSLLMPFPYFQEVSDLGVEYHIFGTYCLCSHPQCNLLDISILPCSCCLVRTFHHSDSLPTRSDLVNQTKVGNK